MVKDKINDGQTILDINKGVMISDPLTGGAAPKLFNKYV